MARIAGVNIPENKHIEISLTHIFGIGRKRAQDICDALGLEYSKKVSDLSEDCLLYTSPSPRDLRKSRMPSSA